MATFDDFKNAILSKDEAKFLSLLEAFSSDSFDINQIEETSEFYEEDFNRSSARGHIYHSRGLIHYLIDANNVNMMRAFLKVPGVDVNLNYIQRNKILRYTFSGCTAEVTCSYDNGVINDSAEHYASRGRHIEMFELINAITKNNVPQPVLPLAPLVDRRKQTIITDFFRRVAAAPADIPVESDAKRRRNH